MTTYIYKARNSSGDIVKGTIEADSDKIAKNKLADQGLYPVSVETEGAEVNLRKIFKIQKKIKSKDLLAFTRQFSALFEAGVPMDRLMSALAKQTHDPDFRNAIEDIRMEISSGSSISDALKKYPNFFDELYVSLVDVGEQGGVLERTLAELASVLDKEYKIKSKIKSATLYPKIVLTVFVIVFVFLMSFVVPKFASFYAGYGAELPMPTKVMIGISDAIKNYWYILVLVVGGGFLIFKRYKKSNRGKFRLDALKFKYPVFGDLTLKVVNARFGHLISALYRSGLSIAKGLGIVGRAMGNRAYKSEIDQITDDVEKGVPLSTAMGTSKYFTPLIIESTYVGEQSGSLDDLLETSAKFYDEEVENTLDQLSTLIEPMLLVGLFALVAGLAFAIFLPIWKISSVVLPS